MKKLNLTVFSIAMLILALPVFAQNAEEAKKAVDDLPEYVTASPAFAEVVFRKAVLESELEELLVRYTNDFPKVAEMRFELSELELAIGKILEVPENRSSKLSIALGKMLVQRAAYATELDVLKRKYNDSHPETKRAARKLEIFDKAIDRIL